MNLRYVFLATTAVGVAACMQSAGAPPRPPVAPSEATTSAAAAQPSERRLLWGDTHLHTQASTDAFDGGGTNADLETAFRFARGLPIVHPRTGQRITIDRPLDFMVSADHAEMMGVFPRLANGDAATLATAGGQTLLRALKTQPAQAYRLTQKLKPDEPTNQLIKDVTTPDIQRSVWAEQVDTIERHNKPGVFTSLIGWEWSSTPNGMNLHRVVFTPAGGGVAKKFLPLSNYDTMRPEDLWKFLRETRARTGADFVAIPHNSNYSQGEMFNLADTEGHPIDRDYANKRMEWERVVEITQYKGTSETHPALSSTDEFADFEIRQTMFGPEPAKVARGSFVRQALMDGLKAEAKIGVNPFALGIIGSTDSHSGLSSQQESAFYGKSGADIYPAERAANKLGAQNAWNVSAGGIAAVWADRNDRRAIYEAFRRREVYGTSGPRISLRVFGGFNFVEADRDVRDLAAVGYRKGVPMGGDLLRARSNRPVSLLIQAVKDPRGANLDRVQVVKGWRDGRGEVHEKIFNVAWSGQRRLGANGLLPPVGDTVDLRTARYSNSIGATELTAVWRDPEFSPSEAAFYYVRVLEIPTPRHQLFDAIALGMDPAKTGQPPTLQERAWSSPVWYKP